MLKYHLKYFLKSTLIVSAFVFPFFFTIIFTAYADSYVEAIGFGEAGVDGVYTFLDTYNGHPRYEKGIYQICFNTVATTWEIKDDFDVDCIGGTGNLYYDGDPGTDLDEPYEVVDWTIGAGGSPAGLVYPFGSGGGTTTSTTTVDTTAQVHFNGIILFLVSFFFVIWFFRGKVTH